MESDEIILFTIIIVLSDQSQGIKPFPNSFSGTIVKMKPINAKANELA